MNKKIILTLLVISQVLSTYAAYQYQLIYGQFLSWNDANVDAISKGGHLVTFPTLDKWQQVTNLFGQEFKTNIWWIGANDAEQDGRWKWVTGEPVSFNRWDLDNVFIDSTNGKIDYASCFDNRWGWFFIYPELYNIGYVLEYYPDPIEIVLIQAIIPSYKNLIVGNTYQLQTSTDLRTWINSGGTFVATNSTWVSPSYWDKNEFDKMFFRLLIINS
jgi:hypothetical protein